MVLVRDAALQIYRKRAALILALIVPILLSEAVLTILRTQSPSTSDDPRIWFFFLISLARIPFYVLFATICHRIVLLGEEALPNRWGLFWSMRETRFLGWLIVIGLIAAVISSSISFSIWLLPFEARTWLFTSPLYFLITYVSIMVSTYFDGRLSLVLPATAVGTRLNPIRSWKMTAGNGWSIFVALMVPILVTWGLSRLLSELIESRSVVVGALRDLLFYPLWVVGIVIITIAYSELTATKAEVQGD